MGGGGCLCPSERDRDVAVAAEANSRHAGTHQEVCKDTEPPEDTTMGVHRRKVLKGLAGIGAAALNAPMVLAQAAPFKVALLTVKTGPLAQGGSQMEQGILTLL